MWYPTVGSIELLLSLCAILISSPLDKSRFKLWTICFACLVAISVLVTPADIVSTLLVAGPLLLTFIAGIRLAPYFQQKQDENNSV